MQAVDAFVHAMTTLRERLQPRVLLLDLATPKKLAAEAAPAGLPQGSRLHGLRRSGAAAERGVVDVARERAAACAQRAVGIRRPPGFAEAHRQRIEVQQPPGERFAHVHQTLAYPGGLPPPDHTGTPPHPPASASFGPGP